MRFIPGHNRDLLRETSPDFRTMTRFAPASGGFVSMAHGGFTLRRVLLPVNVHPDPQPAITYAFRATVFSSEEIVATDVLHVGEENQSLRSELPRTRLSSPGAVVARQRHRTSCAGYGLPGSRGPGCHVNASVQRRRCYMCAWVLHGLRTEEQTRGAASG